ncbi:alpha/beta fold hydrolase [Ornithinibacillus xuwenensis]|uniref:Alpha/beta fold hydrolase n=1 Tax=Ornithinibacillus xuwenensis TaxID=3144668 RepID=A0ABU9XJ77_9BACI
MWEKHVIKTARGSFEYFQRGTGEPLCVTHLYSAFNEKGNTFAEPFTNHYKVFLINLKGCGDSDTAKQDFEYSMEEAVKDLEAIRLSLGYEKWAFAGHSTGGMLALKYAIMAENSLTKIIAGGLCASDAYMEHPDSIYCKENPNNPRIIEIIRALNSSDTPIEERRELNKEWFLMSIYNPSQYEEIIKKPNSGKVVGKRLDYFSKVELKDYDLRPKLSGVRIPAYIYSGLYDAQCPYVFSKEAADLLGNASMTTFERSNHNPFDEQEEKFKAFVMKTLE